MAGLQTGGFSLSALPQAPNFPSNLGKFDPLQVNANTEASLKLASDLFNFQAEQKAKQAQLAQAAAQAQGATAVVPSATGAAIAGNLQSSALAAPDVVKAKKSGILAGLDADLAATQLQRDKIRAATNVRSGLSDAQQVAMDTNSLPKSSVTDTKVVDGKIVSTQNAGVNVGGEVVPTATATETSPAAPVFTPVPVGANGVSPGTAITSFGGGAPKTSFAPAPLAILNKQTVSSEWEPDGYTIDPQTHQITSDNYRRKLLQRDGSFKLDDKVTAVPHGVSPDALLAPTQAPSAQNQVGPLAAPSATPSTQAAVDAAVAKNASTGRDLIQLAAKNKQEALNDLAASAEANNAMAANVDKADKAIQDYNKNSILPNAVRGHMGFLPSVQAVEAAKSQFVSDIMGKLRGAGRVTQQEVQYASAAYPSAEQAQSVQQANIQYLRDLTNTVAQRRAYEYNAIKDGVTPADAKMAAIQKIPIPPPPGYTPTAPLPGSAPATPSPDHIKSLLDKYK
jgi:hypothetical protein